MGCRVLRGIHTLTQLIGMKLVKVSMSGKIHPEYTADTSPICILIDDEYRTGEVFASNRSSLYNRYEIIRPKESIFVDSSFRSNVSTDGSEKSS
ncbi:hypothetical protein NSQ61_05365 [Aeribacillus sp. FSL K6-1121]|uniref:hypothetical protein n=1 Tax=Aeribacillus TaxID=1055323 RepID=UPI00119C8ECB|nr:hypothetical protein [Aeribacillus composti]MED0716418.1 hypothetical protein [Aeribacillus composti]MED0747724.1 hypothetical protein [Aeribacillus composti]TVZ79620.1 hypothetical protein FB379_12217 [Aeribacillus composti]